MNYLPMNLTLYFITEITLIDIKKLWNKLIIPEQSAFTDQLILLYLYCYLLSSRLYCRLRNYTESCLAARGLYHRWGIAPRPEDSDSIDASIRR